MILAVAWAKYATACADLAVAWTVFAVACAVFAVAWTKYMVAWTRYATACPVHAAYNFIWEGSDFALSAPVQT